MVMDVNKALGFCKFRIGDTFCTKDGSIFEIVDIDHDWEEDLPYNVQCVSPSYFCIECRTHGQR